MYRGCAAEGRVGRRGEHSSHIVWEEEAGLITHTTYTILFFKWEANIYTSVHGNANT